ncbi:MAG: CRISPR-associated helicase Cas3' [Planctomycetaceae bacterium]|nr:CRISPR-associated helicase Cas3' [Planctomycetaceae bacterium]
MPPPFFAHSLEGRPPDDWEPLEDHLRAVAHLAARFAQKFDAADWGRLAGLWHGLGKYSVAFQAYLRTQNGLDVHLEQQSRVDHSTAGAQHAHQTVSPWGKLLAYVIAGHHAGLADFSGGQSGLEHRLDRCTIERWDAAPSELLQIGALLQAPKLSIDRRDPDRASFQLALFTRMLFSCLVDADFLATEAFMNPEQAAERPTSAVPLATLLEELERYLDDLASGCEPSDVNQRRAEVLAACGEQAASAPGLFSLTVPTGGGKTLASLAFALRHAVKHGLDRVIYAIPFTSIIEQTAGTFLRALGNLGPDVVLEHHSNLDPERETRRSRLAAENWDAPLIVTTNVQLFESLFASRTSRCRKLHNIVRSVIILDEAQTIPVELLKPCLAVLRELATDYGCSIVLCTATQPAVHREQISIGLEGIREIIPDPPQLSCQMKRVHVHNLGLLHEDELIERLSREMSFLCIVNTRAHAAKLYRSLCERSGTEGLFHLSTLMCGAHRSAAIATIRERLQRNEPCRVVSTQLIEAGVDVDFPVVYRAMTGLDSIAQAAGRCNREGERPCGDVYVFDPTEVKLRGYLGAIASTAREVIPDQSDLLDPAAIERYFQLHYWRQCEDHKGDKAGVMGCFPTPVERFAYSFRTAAERFCMIEDAAHSVFVPYAAAGERFIEELRKAGPSRGLLRRLQRYTVNLYEHTFMDLISAGDVEILTDGGYAVLTNLDAYDEQLGLRIDRPGFREAESNIF